MNLMEYFISFQRILKGLHNRSHITERTFERSLDRDYTGVFNLAYSNKNLILIRFSSTKV